MLLAACVLLVIASRQKRLFCLWRLLLSCKHCVWVWDKRHDGRKEKHSRIEAEIGSGKANLLRCFWQQVDEADAEHESCCQALHNSNEEAQVGAG
jgi:hypothetical protein